MASGGSWKVAYADFVTALMAFFLLMWIISIVPPDKKEALGNYFADPGGYNSKSTLINLNAPPPLADNESLTPEEAANIEIHKFLNDNLQQEHVIDETRIATSEAGVLLRMVGNLTFQHNQADFDDKGKRVLDVVIAALRNLKVQVVVGGHADKSETGGEHYRSKWELAAARAACVTQYLIETGPISPSLLISASYADTKPVSPDGPDYEASANRRVEFFFYRPEMRLKALGF